MHTFFDVIYHFPILDSVVRLIDTGEIGIRVREFSGTNNRDLLIMIYSKSASGFKCSVFDYEIASLTKEDVENILNNADKPILSPYKDSVEEFFREYVRQLWKRDAPHVCFECGDDGSQLTIIDGVGYCDTCVKKNAFRCDHCGELANRDHRYVVAEKEVCAKCYLKAVTCEVCGRKVFLEDVIANSRIFVCADCAVDADKVGCCCICGKMDITSNMEIMEGERFCQDCMNNAITDYHRGPPLTFYGQGRYYFGVELEVDGGDEEIRVLSALKASRILNDHVFCSRDGSLESGFEIISHPHSYNEIVSLPWKEAFTALTQDGWRGHNTTTAGLHIHISKTCFADDDAITRFCTFFENNWTFVKKFSRRSRDSLNRWASRYYRDMGDDDKFKFDDIKRRKDSDDTRYRAVNLSNKETVEVRIFRSTLNIKTFLASIELVKLVAEKCNSISNIEAEKMSEREWLNGASQNLVEYCKSHDYDISSSIYSTIKEEKKICA